MLALAPAAMVRPAGLPAHTNAFHGARGVFPQKHVINKVRASKITYYIIYVCGWVYVVARRSRVCVCSNFDVFSKPTPYPPRPLPPRNPAEVIATSHIRIRRTGANRRPIHHFTQSPIPAWRTCRTFSLLYTSTLHSVWDGMHLPSVCAVTAVLVVVCCWSGGRTVARI